MSDMNKEMRVVLYRINRRKKKPKLNTIFSTVLSISILILIKLSD